MSDSTPPIPTGPSTLRARRAGIDTYQQPVVYMRTDCHVCRAEGFEAQAQVEVVSGGRHLLAILHRIEDGWLHRDQIALSDVAWRLLQANEGDEVLVRHPPVLDSLRHLRAKVHGGRFDYDGLRALMEDVAQSHLTDIHLAAFVTACSGGRLDIAETVALTRAMVDVGERLDWAVSPVMDKHCVGGLPGNRTTLLVVPIVAACGVVMPKTSSRAITSPAGTADTMETLAPVALDMSVVRRVVEREGGCIAWGGAMQLSPADDVLIRVERPLNLDSEGQLVASILSKKAAVGAQRVLIDIPVGPTAKVRSAEAAAALDRGLVTVGAALGLEVRCVRTDGTQPVGWGIGPALEAIDVMAVLERRPDAPRDLRDRAVTLAGLVLEMAGKAGPGQGGGLARAVLDDGRALAKFIAICEAQGGLRVPPVARHTHVMTALASGVVASIDNRTISQAAKLAGAPHAPAAGARLHVHVGDRVQKGQPLYTLHADSPGELAYAFAFVRARLPIVDVKEDA
jgi:thymidine phosphorylase